MFSFYFSKVIELRRSLPNVKCESTKELTLYSMSFQNGQDYDGWNDTHVKNNSSNSNDGGGWGSSSSWGGGAQSQEENGCCGDGGSPNRPRGRGRGRGRGGRGRGRQNDSYSSGGFGRSSFGGSGGGFGDGDQSEMDTITVPKSVIGKLIGKCELVILDIDCRSRGLTTNQCGIVVVCWTNVLSSFCISFTQKLVHCLLMVVA